MHVATTQIFGRNDFARRRLDQRRPCQKDRALFFHNDRHIGHCGHIGPACCARPHHHSNLRNAFGRHLRLIIENPAKMVAVGKHLVLIGQVRPAAVDQIDTWQAASLGDLLGAQVLLDGHRVICATFHGGIIADNHNLVAVDAAHASNHPGAGGGAVIEPVGSRCAHFQKRTARIKKSRHTIARQHLATAEVTGAGFFSTAKGCVFCCAPNLIKGCQVNISVTHLRFCSNTKTCSAVVCIRHA